MKTLTLSQQIPASQTTFQTNNIMVENNKVKMISILFEAWPNKKVWCFCQPAGKGSHGTNYYCYNCKNELFFRWTDSAAGKNNPPHKIFIASKGHYTYWQGYCCKCWNKWVDDPQQPKMFNEGNETFKCDCQEYISLELAETIESIKAYNLAIKNADWLKKQLEKIKKLKQRPSKNEKRFVDEFLARSLNDFIEQLEKQQASNRESRMWKEKHLEEVKTWASKLKQIIN